MCSEGRFAKPMDMVARILLAVVFLMGGLGKITDPAGNIAYMQAYAVPFAPVLLWVAAIFLVISSVLLVVGWKRCWVAGLLVLYTILVTLIFHIDFSDQMQLTLFLKNLGIIGGLLLVMTSYAGACVPEKKD